MSGEEMTCDAVKDAFGDYLAGTLDAEQARALEQHVASCVECQAEYAGVEALWQALGSIPAPPVPSNRMRERFSATIAAERASADRRPASRRVRGRTLTARAWPREPLVQLAMAASLLIGGIVIGRVTTPRPAPVVPSPEIAEVRGELRDMREMLTLSLLQQQSATERLRGVSWTAQIDQPGSEVVTALLDTLLHDPSVNVRLAAIDALRRFSDRPDVRLGTKRAVTDRSWPLLQVAVIDFMVETRDPEAPALFRALAQDTSVDESVRGRAQWGLEQFAS
jgi:hypothetical protein